MKIYALVGPSGTGKSYKALEVAYEYDIKYIIDDGILIHKNKIIGGISAKQADTIMEAVKRAIFNDDNHRDSIKDKLEASNIDKILIMGTSNKMIYKIISRLELNEVHKIINIKDISTSKEIEIAKESRKKGNHIIPAPIVEIKSMANGLSINSLKRLFKKRNNSFKVIEKTTIRPRFSYKGKFYISTKVIYQILEYEISKISNITKVNDVEIVNTAESININLNINLNNFKSIKNIGEIQDLIKRSIEEMTLVNVERVDIYINKIKKIS